MVQPFKPSRCIKASFYILENRLTFSTIKGFRTKIFMKLVYQYMAIFFNFPHFKSSSFTTCRLVVDVDDNGKLRLKRVKQNKKIQRCKG